jgi:TonB family protein
MTSHHDRVEVVTAALIRRAARSAPAELVERLEEEWLADLASRRSALARLRLAAGCLWATQVIAHDFVLSGATASAATAQRSGIVALGSHGAPFSRRTTILLLIIGLHVAMIYAFASGFYAHIIPAVTHPTVVRFLPPTPQTRNEPPPRIQRDRASDRIVVPPVYPAGDVRFDPQDPTPVTETGGTGTIDPQPPLTHPLVKRISGGPGAGFPETDDYYPASAIRQRQEGAAVVQVCVNERGNLRSDPTLMTSSGFALLDEGALKLAKAGSGHYRASTEGGQPVSDCFAYRVHYKLKQ